MLPRYRLLRPILRLLRFLPVVGWLTPTWTSMAESLAIKTQGPVANAVDNAAMRRLRKTEAGRVKLSRRRRPPKWIRDIQKGDKRGTPSTRSIWSVPATAEIMERIPTSACLGVQSSSATTARIWRATVSSLQAGMLGCRTNGFGP